VFRLSTQLQTYGDGNSSSQTNGSNAFSNAGNYLVTLSSSNAAGCQNSSSQNITIYSVPQPDFAIEAPPLSCANSPSQFDNLTPPLVDSNISSWSWKFGDALNGSSKIKNPTYTYSSANNYTVALVATTNVGCTDSIKKTITIFPLPQAGFTNLPACINQGTQFNDASTGSISFYQWSVQNSILQGKTPLPYTFKSSGGFPVTLTVTGNNGCLNQITKTINVPLKPIIDFTLQAPCTGHPTSFQELNTGGADPAIAWNWNFEQGSGTGSPVSYQFPSEGGYTVTMNTTRQSGCVYSTSKNISISAGPVANFTPSIFAGAAPLDVIFNNTSTAETYLWQFDDANQTTSTNDSPEFIYTQLGKYKVLLSAYNSLGCSDTLSTEIDVVVPHIDIAMNNFLLTSDPSSNSSKAVVTILNSGNIPLVDPEIFIDFGGNASVKEKISGLIRPGKSLVQTLGLQIVPRSLQYICAEIDAVDDINSTNNKRCISLSNEDVIMTPYPNPSTDGEITLEWVGAQEDVTITIFRTNGEIAFAKNLDAISAGLGQLTINTSVFSNGLYLIQFTGNKATKAFRIMIAN
jgi:PKD repeat protein